MKENGKWYKIGTTSYGDWFAKKAIAYLTPIENVISAKYDSSSRTFSSPRGSRLNIPLKITNLNLLKEKVSYNGILQSFLSDFKIKEEGVVGFGGDGGKNNSFLKTLPDVHAGEVLGVQLMWGDIEYIGYGTVSHIKGKDIWLFGHPFFQLGPVEYGLVRAEVLDSQPSYMASYIIPRSTGKAIGKITQDRSNGIYGVLGQAPQNVISVKINLVASNGDKKDINFTLTNNAWLTPKLLSYAVFSTAVSYMRFWGDVTIFQTERIYLTFGGGKTDTLTSANSYVSSNGVPPELYIDLRNKFTNLLNNPYENVKIKNIEYTLKTYDERRERKVSKAYFVDDKPSFAQGESTILKIILTQPRKEPLILDFPFTIPKDVKDGVGKIIVGNASAVQEQEGVQKGSGSLRSMFEFLKSSRREDAVYVYIVYPPYELEKEKGASMISKGFRKISKRFASNIEEYELPLEGFSVDNSTTIPFRVGKGGSESKSEYQYHEH